LQTLRVLFALVFFAARASAAAEVIVPEAGNLQYLSFWVAQGAGYLDAKVRVPDSPGETGKLFRPGAAQVAVLPPPLFFQLVGDGVPLVAVANLLRNDAIDLVVRQSVASARKLGPKLPLAEKLRRLKGLKLGVAPGPVSRLRALYQSVGVPLDVEIVTLMGQEQNQALADGRVDGLYAHTPYLERALANQGCVVVVNQAGGEVPALAARQIHMLAVTEPMLRTQRATVDKLVDAIARAEKLLHQDRRAALAALFQAVPPQDDAARALASRLVDLYADAIPDDPAVSVEGLRRALELYPAGKRPPDLSHVDWNRLVLPRPPH
jgi:ABC-type nitrate/sulfonate/bicarbonate transport system substrate-binding protein